LDQVSNVLVLGLIRGTLYTLLALGFALIFSVARVINLAHGAYYMMGAYFTYIVYQFVLGGGGRFAIVAAIITGVVCAGLVGLFQFYVLLRQLKTPYHDYILVMSLALALFTGEIFRQLFGVRRAAAPAIMTGSSDFLGVRIINQELLILPLALVVIPAVLLWLKYTKQGRSVTAVAQNREGAILMGINPTRVLAMVFFLAAVLAALAGAMIAPVREVDPLMWVTPLISSFAIVVRGGLGSIYGPIAAAFLLGIVEMTAGLQLGERFTELVGFVVVIVVLATRPTGRFGRQVSL
jgi:branched-chain amino acid transport system permease protein